MNIQIIKEIAKGIKPVKGSIKLYREEPDNVNRALYAGLHYAVRDQKTMLIIPRHSYMRKVFHIVNINKNEITSIAPIKLLGAPIYQVHPNGNMEEVKINE